MKAQWIFCVLFFAAFLAEADNYILSSRTDISGAPSIKFILDEDYLIAQTIAKDAARGQYKSDIIAFDKAAWAIDQNEYKKLLDNSDVSPAYVSSAEFKNEFSPFFNKVKETAEYKTLRQQTVEYINSSAEEWNANLEKSFPFISKYSGFSFGYEVTAYITHPAVGNGVMQNRELKILSYGAWPEFPNYFTVYIWHEIIHFHMELNSVSHAVNQLLTDNGLRVELKGGSLYPLQGHSDLVPLMEQTMPAWNEYKKAPTNLNDFVKGLPPYEGPPLEH